MNRNIPPISEQRVREIIDAYGATPARWPDEERQAASERLAQSPMLEEYCRQHANLDQLIDSVIHTDTRETPALQALQQRILDRLPEQQHQLHSMLFSWLSPPRLALAGIGLLTVALVLLMNRPPAPVPAQTDSAYEVWAWYDITGQELPQENTGTAMTMTDFVELDESPDNS